MRRPPPGVLALIEQSLQWTERALQAYSYPSVEMKRERLAEVDAARAWLRTGRSTRSRLRSTAEGGADRTGEAI